MFPTFDLNNEFIICFHESCFFNGCKESFLFKKNIFIGNFFDLNSKLLTRRKTLKKIWLKKIMICRFKNCENMWWTRYKSAKQRKRMVSMNKSLLLQLVNSEWLPLQFQVFLKIYFAMQYIVSFEHLEKSIGQIDKLRMLQNLRFPIYMSNDHNGTITKIANYQETIKIAVI